VCFGQSASRLRQILDEFIERRIIAVDFGSHVTPSMNSITMKFTSLTIVFEESPYLYVFSSDLAVSASARSQHRSI
jgi:hypothetical protein